MRKLKRWLLILPFLAIAITAAVQVVAAESASDKAEFRLFDGLWNIKEGPFADYSLFLGKTDDIDVPFALVDLNALRFDHPFRVGEISSVKGGKIKGTFKLPKATNAQDPVSDLGLTESGNFKFELKAGSLYELSGSFTGKDGSVFPVSASAAVLTFSRAKFVLKIEPTKRRQFKTGESVTFEINAELRGPAGVTAAQPELQVALSSDVAEISVEPVKNITACDVKYDRQPNQVACSFAVLGPKHADARIFVTAVVPAKLAGQRLVAAAAVDDVPGYDPSRVNFPIFPSSVPRSASVKIKKLSGLCPTVVGQWNTNSGPMNFKTDGTYTYNFGGIEGTGLWKCELRDGQVFILIGLETSTGPYFPEAYPLTQNGTHFEGYSTFGGYVTADKA